MPNQHASAGSIAFSINTPKISCIIPDEANYRSSTHVQDDNNIVDEIFAHFGYVRGNSPVPFKVIDGARHGSIIVVQDLTPHCSDFEDDDDFESVFSEDDFSASHKPKLTLSMSEESWMCEWSTVSGSGASSPKHEDRNVLVAENESLRKELEEMKLLNSKLMEENSLLQAALDTAIHSKQLMMATVSDAFNRVRQKFCEPSF